MSFWQKTALSAALVGAVGFGAAVAPTVSGQSRVRVVEPSDVHSWGDVASSRYIGRTEYLIRHRRRYRTGLRRRLVTRKIDPSTAPVAASEALSSSTSQPLSFST